MVEEINFGSCDVRIGLVKFGSESSIQFHLKEYRSRYDIQNAIDKVEFSYGHCYMAGALRTIHSKMFRVENGARVDSKKIVFIVGRAIIDSKPYEIMEQIRIIKNMGIYLSTLAVESEEEGIATMSKMASSFEGAWSIEYFSQITKFYVSVLRYIFYGY